MQWVFAALNSVEPSIVILFLIDVVFAKEEWAKLRRQSAFDFARRRLGDTTTSKASAALSGQAPTGSIG